MRLCLRLTLHTLQFIIKGTLKTAITFPSSGWIEEPSWNLKIQGGPPPTLSRHPHVESSRLSSFWHFSVVLQLTRPNSLAHWTAHVSEFTSTSNATFKDGLTNLSFRQLPKAQCFFMHSVIFLHPHADLQNSRLPLFSGGIQSQNIKFRLCNYNSFGGQAQ